MTYKVYLKITVLIYRNININRDLYEYNKPMTYKVYECIMDNIADHIREKRLYPI